MKKQRLAREIWHEMLAGAIRRVKKWPTVELDLPTLLWSMLFDETDRGCLLSSAAFLDNMLEDVIRRKFKDLSDASREDLDFLLTSRPIPPLGSMGVRIVVTRALGLIDPSIRGTLTALKDLRNSIAHHWLEFNFTEDNVDRLFRFLSKDDMAEVIAFAESLSKFEGEKLSFPRWKFNALFCHLASGLY